MCGIAGFVGQGARADLDRMTRRLVHRGPDGGGAWHEGDLFLGHRRLVILDEEGGVQPMWTRDRQHAVVFNGEIYNHGQLREQLEASGHRFESDHSDTEVLLHGYREWGLGVFERLNGMWALALLDRPGGRLVLCRDRFGQKPLYYFEREGVFAFASELGALREHPLAPSGTSRLALLKYLAYGFVPGSTAIISGVHKLGAGQYLVLDLGTRSAQTKRWWSFQLEPDPGMQVEQLKAPLLEALERAVERRLVADVPVGMFLSGGLDSSLLAALASRHHRDLQTFSLGFEESSFDESPVAGRVAAFLGTRHHASKLTLDDARAAIPGMLDHLDEPLADSSLIPTHALCRSARQRVTVALGGDGGDELFAGYAPFRALKASGIYARLIPRPLHEGVRLALGRVPVGHGYMSLDFKLKRTLQGLSYPPSLWCPAWMGQLEPRELADAVEGPMDLEEVYSEAIEAWEATSGDPVDRATMFFVRLYFADDILTKIDRASMRESLEVRSPFLDIDLVNLVRRVPHALRLRHGTTKWILREVARGLVPDEVRGRAKQGFAMPVGLWFREGALTLDTSMDLQWQRGAFVERQLRQHREGRRDNRLYLWGQLVLQHFARR